MKARFLLLPAILAASALGGAPARAKIYLSVQEAQRLMFPDTALSADARGISDAEAAEIERKSGVPVKARRLEAWRAEGGGWFIVDEVAGDHDFIPFALALDARGAVRAVEILEYREYVGGEVRDPQWLAQFLGKTDGASLELDTDVENISGATLSSQHLTDGIRRLLATYAVVLAGH